MRWRDRKLPNNYSDLAAYNGRIYQGIVHTPEYTAKMESKQEEFDKIWREKYISEGYEEISPGNWRKM